MADTIEPPKTPSEANKLLGELRKVDSEIATGAANCDNQLRSVISEHTTKAKPLLEKRQKIVDALEDFGREHRDEIVAPGTKTARFAQGTISWKMGKGKVVIAKDQTKSILKQLRNRGWLRRFTVQPARKLDKAALLKDPEAVAKLRGVEIVQGEHMYVQPKESKIEEIEKESPYHIPPKED